MSKDTLLIRAVLSGDIKNVLALITPETINAKGELGKTPLQNAVLWESKFDAIVNALLSHDADVNSLDDIGHTPLSDAGKGALKTDDVYARRACKLIEKGALWPDTKLGKFAWQKLPPEVQQLFTEKLQAYQEQQARLQAEEKTKAFGVLSNYARSVQTNSNTQSFTTATFPTGLHHRSNSTSVELKTF
jgi:hypothetical protein